MWLFIKICRNFLIAVSCVSPALAFETSAKQALLMDFATVAILLEKDIETPVPPASLSKLMTSYMVFEEIQLGGLAMEDMLPVSEKAWRMGGSKMFVEVGKTVSVEDLLRGVIVQSGNDACIVLAETIAGSEEAFSDLMTDRGHEIGLQDSTFTNATGWPDSGHKMSARDIALITKQILIDHPNYFPLFAEKEFTYNGIRQGNRNPLLYKNIGVDGMKTGHTSEAGYGLAATAVRNNRRLILVLTGMETAQQRAIESERLFDWGFRKFKNYQLFKKGDTVSKADVWLGKIARVPLEINDNLTVTLPRDARDNLHVSVHYESPIPAPVEKGDIVAQLRVKISDSNIIQLPLVAGETVDRSGLLGRLSGALGYMIFGPPPEK